MKRNAMQSCDHQFAARDLVGGHVVLDFANTVTAWNTAPVDWLDGFPKLLDWATLAAVIGHAEQDSLARLATKDLPGAQAALARIKRLRKALYALFKALIEGEAVPEAPLQEVERTWRRAANRMQLAPVRGGAKPTFDVADSALDLIGDRLIFTALALLDQFPFGRARICQSCGWMFIDRSKAGRRIWCDMATCGNTAKSRRHYARLRQGRSRVI
jgi:predicted RNA-binding Zn ribbon-like protein